MKVEKLKLEGLKSKRGRPNMTKKLRGEKEYEGPKFID
jgi:hypothetical protein